jgi:hypothetical protein
MRIRIMVAGVVAVVACVVAAPASATQNQVSGVQTPGTIGSACSDPLASFTMTGGLVGCWYEDLFNITKDQVTPSGIELVHFSGTEHFTGCLDTDGDQCEAGDPSGTLSFVYSFTGQYVAGTNLAIEIRGRCHHPIVGGTGDFTGATGVINFKDDVSNPALVTSPYMGHVTF